MRTQHQPNGQRCWGMRHSYQEQFFHAPQFGTSRLLRRESTIVRARKLPFEANHMSDEHISEDEFWEKWGVILKADGVMFEHEDVKDHPLEHVWTIVDTGAYEDENWYAMPGFHIVNKLGYIMTKRAWSADTPDAIYYLHEDEDDGNRMVFLYRHRDASTHKAVGMLLLHGATHDVEEDMIRDCCDVQTYFIAEQIGVPVLREELSVFGGGPTDDDHASHEFQGLREATAEEIVSLPLWGGLRDLTCRFLRTGGQRDCSPSPDCS